MKVKWLRNQQGKYDVYVNDVYVDTVETQREANKKMDEIFQNRGKRHDNITAENGAQAIPGLF